MNLWERAYPGDDSPNAKEFEHDDGKRFAEADSEDLGATGNECGEQGVGDQGHGCEAGKVISLDRPSYGRD